MLNLLKTSLHAGTTILQNCDRDQKQWSSSFLYKHGCNKIISKTRLRSYSSINNRVTCLHHELMLALKLLVRHVHLDRKQYSPQSFIITTGFIKGWLYNNNVRKLLNLISLSQLVNNGVDGERLSSIGICVCMFGLVTSSFSFSAQ